MKVVKVAGYDAKRFSYEPKTDLKYEIVVLEANNKLYEFWLQSADSERAFGAEFFNQILSTFRFE